MAVLKTVRDAGIDIEVNSGSELFKALRVGFRRPDQIIFNGTSKSDENLTRLSAPGSMPSISIDHEIGLVEEAVKRARNPGRLHTSGARHAPSGSGDWDSLASGITDSVAYFGSAFRPLKSLTHFAAACRTRTSSRFVEFIFVGSQTPDVEPFAEAFRSMWNTC